MVLCRVTLLDHHKTAFEEMESHVDTPKNLEVNLDMHLSGATIALQYFKPQVAQICSKCLVALSEEICMQSSRASQRSSHASQRSFTATFLSASILSSLLSNARDTLQQVFVRHAPSNDKLLLQAALSLLVMQASWSYLFQLSA